VLLLSGYLSVPARSAESNRAQINAQVAAGKAIYDTTCSACHGVDGVGARAPTLNHSLAETVIRDTILNGRPGTPMPVFKDVLDAGTLAQVIAYVTSLASAGQAPANLVVVDGLSSPVASSQTPRTRMPWLASNASSPRVMIGAEYGYPAAGAGVFFDPSKLTSCHTCHRYQGAGGPIGDDLASTGTTPLVICGLLSKPEATAAGYPAVAISMIDGTRILGIERDENTDTLRYFDLSSLPPVLRSVPESEINSVERLTTGVYDHTALPISRQDRLDVCAFLGHAAKAVKQ
jgi:mono/diheme cytochrome c family protein